MVVKIFIQKITKKVYGLHKGKKRFYRRFMASYLLLIFTMLLIGSLTYFTVRNIIEESDTSSRIAMMEHSKNIIDINLREMDEMALQIAHDPILSALQNIDIVNLPGSDVMRLIQASTRLESYKAFNPFKKNLYIFYENGVVGSDTTVKTNIEFFYNNFLKVENLDYKDWHKEIFEENKRKRFVPVRKMSINNVMLDEIAYIQPISIDIYGNCNSAILFLIDLSTLANLMKEVNIDGLGTTYILDGNNTVLANLSGNGNKPSDVKFSAIEASGYYKELINGKKMIITYTTSARYNLKYVSVLPEEIVLAKMIQVRNIVCLVIFAMLSIGILIALIMAYQNSKPFKSAVNILNGIVKMDSEKENDEYTFLHNGIQMIIKEKSNLTDELQKANERLKSSFLDRLLKGDFELEEDITNLLNSMEFDIHNHNSSYLEGYDGFVVMILNFNVSEEIISREAFKELSLACVTTENQLRSCGFTNFFTHIFGTNEIAIILYADDTITGTREERIDALLAKLGEELAQQLGVNLKVGIGEFHRKYRGICKSYKEAREALNFLNEVNTSENTIWYKSLEKEKKAYYYPLDIERSMINAIKSGNSLEVEKILTNLYSENYLKKSLSDKLKECLIRDIHNTFIKNASDIALPSYLAEEILSGNVSKFDDSNVTFEWIKAKALEMCGVVNGKKKSHNKTLYNDIIKYINSSYMDSNLDIKQISSQFGISETYLSHFFKEQTGESFSSYLETIRINKACDLLKSKKETINSISTMVGYCNVFTFRRAFKKLMGIVPTEYK